MLAPGSTNEARAPEELRGLKQHLREFFNEGWSNTKTLKEWIDEVLSKGKEMDEQVIAIIKTIPEERRGPYRDLWVKHRRKR